MSVITVTFENGTLMPSHADGFFRYHDSERTTVEADGDVESPVGHFSLLKVERDDIARYVSAWGDPWVSEHRNFQPGWYILAVGSSGTIWAFHYESDEELARKDFAEAQRVYSEWVGDTRTLNDGELALILNNLNEIRAEAQALINEIRDCKGKVDTAEASLAWNALGVLAGDLANVNKFLYPAEQWPDGGPID